jgi:hypothetical protein
MIPANFYLGTHQPSWFSYTSYPLFVARQRLERRNKPGELRVRLPVAEGPWCLDSGGFNEVHSGGWRITPRTYVRQVRRARNEIGRLKWAAPMDWMCESSALAATGLTIADHQRLTVDNWLELRSLDSSLPIIPVLQGFSTDDYFRCIDLYERAGIDLTRQPIVGLGSVCRRQSTYEIAKLVAQLSAGGLRLHGFGVKTLGLKAYGHQLTSADSLAWSLRGKNVKPCAHGPAQSEANCFKFATAWRARTLAGMAGGY